MCDGNDSNSLSDVQVKDEPNADDSLYGHSTSLCKGQGHNDGGDIEQKSTVPHTATVYLENKVTVTAWGDVDLPHDRQIPTGNVSHVSNGDLVECNTNTADVTIADTARDVSRLGTKRKVEDGAEKTNSVEEPKKRKEKDDCICDICKKTFHKKSYLSKHMMIHTGELPFKCEFCNKAFNVRSNLTVHLRIHTGQKPHDCQLCKRSFRQAGQLEYHMRTHTGEKPYECKTCSRRFRNSSALITHQRTHTGERPFTCEVCSRSFSTSTSLKTHKVTHSGSMLYECPMCGRQFNRKNNLNVHIKRHDKQRKFSCPLCSNGFVMRAHFLNHLKRSHNIDGEEANCKYKDLLEQCSADPHDSGENDDDTKSADEIKIDNFKEDSRTNCTDASAANEGLVKIKDESSGRSVTHEATVKTKAHQDPSISEQGANTSYDDKSVECENLSHNEEDNLNTAVIESIKVEDLVADDNTQVNETNAPDIKPNLEKNSASQWENVFTTNKSLLVKQEIDS